VNVEYFDIEDKEEFKNAFTNINHPSDLEKIIRDKNGN
jgi:molybdopterin-guanine dinucleotide biosynthesis protein A